jgi:hypothetical protein
MSERFRPTTMDRMVAPYLPEPTGPHPVGMTSMGLAEVMISIWYPAAAARGPRAGYLTRADAELMLAGRTEPIEPIEPDELSSVRTNAFADAPPAGAPRRLPLVLLSPGFAHPRATLTSIAEDLASHGYVAVAVDHTHQRGPRDQAFWVKVVTDRASDVSSVLDELLGADPSWPGAALIDPDRIGMAGHSAGGAASIAAMLADPRILAGSDVDGSTDPLIPDTGLARPFLFLGRDGQYSPGDGPAADTWARDWPLLTGWKRWLVVAGAAHQSFTDVGLLADQLGIPFGAQALALRTMAITRAYLRAFFDQHLRGQHRALFDHPEAPEVRLCRS